MTTKRFLFILLITLTTACNGGESRPVSDLEKNAGGGTSENLISVTFETTLGNFTVTLDSDKAPITVNNFLQYVDDGFYDGTIFHRVIDNFRVQGGGFAQDMEKKSTREPVQNEANNGLLNTVGTIAMARTGDPHSATSQFFINVNNNAFLNHSAKSVAGWGYAVFGSVSEGMDTINAIKAVPTGNRGRYQNVPIDTVVINRVVRTPN